MLGWTGITLNVTTGLVASIVLGIAVDDSIHFLTNLTRFARERAKRVGGGDVALMTEIVELRKGERLLQIGQKSDAMYVVIEGHLKSSVERDGVVVPLNRHGRGDVLGEVGLFRGERTANVDCETDVRALRFNQENLARLQRRYPRTASKLLRNLSEVLADRLAAATVRMR